MTELTGEGPSGESGSDRQGYTEVADNDNVNFRSSQKTKRSQRVYTTALADKEESTVASTMESAGSLTTECDGAVWCVETLTEPVLFDRLDIVCQSTQRTGLETRMV